MNFFKLPILMFFSMVAFATTQPIFYRGEQVTYKVPFFYHKVCSGKGNIKNYRFGEEDEGNITKRSCIYTIEVPENDIIHGCPDTMEVSEKDIKAVE